MHVLIIPSEHFVTARYPLGGIFQLQQASILHRAGYSIGVISPGVISARFLGRGYPYHRFERSNGYPVFRDYVQRVFPRRWRPPESEIPLYQRLGYGLYESYIAEFGRPDLIHAHNLEYAGFIAQGIRARDRVPYVITEHSNHFFEELFSPSQARVMASCVRDAGAVTAVSRALASAMRRQLTLDRVGVLHNVIDSYVVQSPLVDDGDRGSQTRFVAIGSLDANKNHKALIEAFARHFKGKADTLRIGGSGPLERRLRKLADQLGVTGQVSFLGRLSRSSVLRELQRSDCLVLPSLQETFGVVLIEALASGRPVIATRSGGPEDVVTEANGLLVPPGDTVGLGEAMERLARTKDSYSPQSLREELVVRFGEDAFIDRVGDLYCETLRGR